MVHGAIADNKYLLLHSGMRLEVEEMQDTVYSDEKWVRFILNQLIANAVKYRTKQPVLRISTHKRQDQVVLVVEDNGIGIAASDLPRIFEKGFTGQNGRMVQQSTGIGLYHANGFVKSWALVLRQSRRNMAQPFPFLFTSTV